MTYCHIPFQDLKVNGASVARHVVITVARNVVVTDDRKLSGWRKEPYMTQNTDFAKVARVNATAFTAVIKCDLLCPDFHETHKCLAALRVDLLY